MESACNKAVRGSLLTSSLFVLIAVLIVGLLPCEATAGVLIRRVHLKSNSSRVINTSEVIAKTNPQLNVGRGTIPEMEKIRSSQAKYRKQLEKWELRRDQAIAKARIQREQEYQKERKEREKRAAKAAASRSKPARSFGSIFGGGSDESTPAKLTVDKKSEPGSNVLRSDEPGQPKKKQSFWARLWHALFG